MNSKISKMPRSSRINWKKMLGAAMLSAFTLAPIVAGSTPAMADRDDWKNRDKDHRGRENYKRDNNSSNKSYRETRTYEGIVTNDQPGREFVLRLDNGQIVQVRSEEREPRRLSNGDRVRVQGYFLRTGEQNRSNTRYNDRVVFRATDVQITRNTNNNRYGNNGNRYGNNGGIYGGYGNNDIRRSVIGVVTDVRSDRRVTVRADDRDYDVESAWKLNSEIRRGTRVQVSGEMRGNNITRAAIVPTSRYGNRYGNGRNDDNYGNGNYGNGNYGNGNYGNGNYGNYGNSDGKFEFNGRVTDVDERERSLRVRGDNGRDYSLRAEDRDDLKGVRRGDRVRVSGKTRNGTSIVDDVDKI